EAEPLDESGPRIVYVNESFTRMTGYSAEEAVGRSPGFLHGARTDPAVRDRIHAALSAWQPVQVELIHYRKDGTPFWLEISIVPVADDNGFFTHFIAVCRETTERKQAERALQESQANLSALIENTTDAIWSVDRQQRIITFNSAVQTAYQRAY